VAKRSRRPARFEAPASRQPADTDAQKTTSATSSRARPARSRRVAQQSFFERYRSLIYGGAAVIGVIIVAWFFLGTAQAGYRCDTLLQPGPTESLTPRPPTPTPSPSPTISPSPTPSPIPSATPVPSGSPSESPSAIPSESPSAEPSATPTPTAAASPTPRLGFTTPLFGAIHVRDQVIEYGFCPPTSGNHYAQPRAPIRAGVYPKTEEQIPGTWIHNLEHGYVVALYRCPSDADCPTDAEMAQLQAFFDQAPTSVNPACPTKIIVARLDQMSTRFALLAWGRALLTDEFDLDTALTFAQQWTDHEAVPERGLC
jgi:hypothetical protein